MPLVITRVPPQHPREHCKRIHGFAVRPIHPYVWYGRRCRRYGKSKIHRGEGLNVALQKIGIKVNDVLAVGDATNDIPMFELVGQSVAIGGYFDSLATVASVVSTYPHGDTFTPLVNAVLGD